MTARFTANGYTASCCVSTSPLNVTHLQCSVNTRKRTPADVRDNNYPLRPAFREAVRRPLTCIAVFLLGVCCTGCAVPHAIGYQLPCPIMHHVHRIRKSNWMTGRLGGQLVAISLSHADRGGVQASPTSSPCLITVLIEQKQASSPSLTRKVWHRPNWCNDPALRLACSDMLQVWQAFATAQCGGKTIGRSPLEEETGWECSLGKCVGMKAGWSPRRNRERSKRG
jgi:hypothetical protein